MVHAAVEAISTEVHAGARTLSVSVSEEPMSTSGDFQRLAQCLSNLLHNAVKFTPPGGHISVNAHPLGDEVLIVVKDNGEGISPAAIGRVFERFMQESGERSVQGLGLGLSLTHEIIAAHGGSVVASSPGKGKGAKFEIRLPRIHMGRAGDAPNILLSPALVATKSPKPV